MAWFSCYAPYEEPRFAVALCLEEGGSGGTTGSPIAAHIMDAAIQSLDGKLDEKLTVLSATKVEGESGSTDNTDDTSDEDSEE